MLRRRMFIMLGITLLVVLALAAYKGFSIYQQVQMFSAPQPAINVSAAPAELRPWQARLPAIGTLKAFQGVDLSTEVDGTVRELLFQSGEQVRAGQPLLQLDSAVERAILDTAVAVRSLARVEFERGKNLAAKQAISKSEFDRLNAELLKAEASVSQLQASLDKKRLHAPFSGTIGIRQVDVGDFVSTSTVIATLQDLSQLFIDFYLPEQAAPKLAVGQEVEVSVAAYPGEQFMAKIVALNPKVEDSTRNLQVRAQLPNPQGKLLPGMFANLSVLLPGQAEALTVAETAITFTLYGNSVYVVAPKQGDDGKPQLDDKGLPYLVVERRFVKTGERRAGRVVIESGLKAGEQVVTSGQLKLDNGAHVTIVADTALTLNQDASAAQ